MRIDKSIRLLFRFRLRTLLLAITILSLGLGMRVRQARQQQEAVNVILTHNGQVTFDADIGESYYASPPNRRRWLEEYYSSIPSELSLAFRRRLRPIVGRHFVDRVVFVVLPINLRALLREFNQEQYGNGFDSDSHRAQYRNGLLGDGLVQDSQFYRFVLNRCSLSDDEWKTVLKLKSVERIQGVFEDDDQRYLSQFPKLRTLQSYSLNAGQNVVAVPGVKCTLQAVHIITFRIRGPILRGPILRRPILSRSFGSSANRHKLETEVSKPTSIAIEL